MEKEQKIIKQKKLIEELTKHYDVQYENDPDSDECQYASVSVYENETILKALETDNYEFFTLQENIINLTKKMKEHQLEAAKMYKEVRHNEEKLRIVKEKINE